MGQIDGSFVCRPPRWACPNTIRYTSWATGQAVQFPVDSDGDFTGYLAAGWYNVHCWNHETNSWRYLGHFQSTCLPGQPHPIIP